MYQPKDVITTADEVRQILGDILPTQAEKVIDHIDPMCRAWIERSPFCVLATRNRRGQMDAAPKGDPPGFVRVLDEKTLALPDRRGNNRADSLMNIIESSEVALIFFVPKRRETVRVNGKAVVARDAPLKLDYTIGNENSFSSLFGKIDFVYIVSYFVSVLPEITLL